ncbi:MAG: prepilin-type N-terminal cleavage/methylation domain-containing protein [Candidatus Binatia bacterium]
MQLRPRGAARGFTLIETAVALLIVSIVATNFIYSRAQR